MTVGHIAAIYFSLALNFLFGSHYIAERMQDEWFRDLCTLLGLLAYWTCLFLTFRYAFLWIIGEQAW